MLFYQISASTTNGKLQKSHIKKIKSKISVPTWNTKFELSDESYSVPEIQDYFEYIIKKQG